MSDAARLLAAGAPGLDLPPDADQLRGCPVHRIPTEHADLWLVTGHAEIRAMLSDPRFSRAAAIDPEHPDPSVDTSLLALDPPEHTRLRAVVSRHFGNRRVAALREGTRRIADGLLDALTAGPRPVDLVPAYCLLLPVQVICDLLGVPAEDRTDFCRWSDELLTTSPAAQAVRDRAQADLDAYMARLVAGKRRDPGEDLLSELVTAADEHDRLTERELVDLGVGILVGGHETTATQLANFTYLLLRDPDLADRLRAAPDLVPAAVEEMLRLVPLGGGLGGTTARVAVAEVDLGGTVLPAGSAVIGATALANRDPDVFPDPDRVRLDRDTNPHLTFGHGAHHCLGSQLARMELQVGLTALLTRLPGLRFAVPEADLPWRTDSAVRGLRALPVTW